MSKTNDEVLTNKVARATPSAVAVPGEDLVPVAWRVRDFADGWVLCDTKNNAEYQSREMSGALIEMLYSAATITTLQAEMAMVKAALELDRKVIAWANNSLYGSHGYFLSLDGGRGDEHHLDTCIEKDKAYAREQWRRAEAAEARVAHLTAALGDTCAAFSKPPFASRKRRADDGPFRKRNRRRLSRSPPRP